MPAAVNIRSCREPSFLKTEASLNEIIWNGANPPLPQPAHAGSPLREGAIVCKGEKGRQCPAQLRCINMRCAPAGQAHPRETKARRPAQSQAAQPTQKRTGGQSRRSCTRQDIRTNARHRPSTQPNPSGTANPKAHRRPKPPQLHPAGYTHQRETQAKHPAEPQAAQPTQKRTGGTAAAAVPGGTTRQREIKGPDVRIRQNKPHPTRISGPRQPAPGSGEPRKRLKLRSAMLNYVSCLGMTTYKVSANIRFHRTQRRQKSAFLWGYPRFFWQDKRNGVQRAQWP